MSLTGIPLILLAAVITVGSLGATVLVWRRWGRWRYVVRPAGVLLVEALLTTTIGLAVNRSQQFYPSWAALFATSDPSSPSYHTAAGRLDAQLAQHPDNGQAQTFPWQPTGWTAWDLAAPPTVTVPAGYLEHAGWRYSAVLVVADAADGWQAAGRVPALTGPTVLISVTTTAKTTPATLGVTIPGELERDLRVTGHRWALVSSARDGALAEKAVSGTRGRYPAVAFVGVAAPGTHPAAAPPSQPTGKLASEPVKKPAKKPVKKATAKPGKTTAKPTTVAPPGTLPVGVETSYFPVAAKSPTGVTGSLRAALAWAAAQTPPPLAASAPEPKYLPIPPKKSPAPRPGADRGPHAGRKQAPPAKPHTAPTPLGGPDGSGQPRP